MYIKQVVIDGFKSYAQRTEILGFDPLFNAITGLNGSGKSNILDAICFLFGISNLSQVRVGSLQELVYKGGQAGITKATVIITFDNADKKQSPLGYESYDEITVARQIVIGGRNKYLINGSNATPSRVQDLFRSVQLNVNNPHFLIMQGRITKVLNMKPPEILAMIEEAAGTRMYESKRTAAQKTIMKKDSKLKEIETILEEEITPTLTKLKEERSSYLDYQKLTRELEHLTRLVIAHQFVHAEQCRKQSSADLDGLHADIKEFTAMISEKDDRIKLLKKRMREIDEQQTKDSRGVVQELERKADECAKAFAVAEATVKNSKDMLSAEQKNQKALLKSISEDKALIEAKVSEIQGMEGAHQSLQERSKSADKAVLLAQQHFQAVTAGLSSNAQGQDETLATQKIACESEITAAHTVVKQAELRLKSLQADVKKQEKASKGSESSYTKDKAVLESIQREMNKLEQAMKKLNYQEGEEERLIEKREQLKAEVAELKSKIDGLESRMPQVEFSYQDPAPGFNRERVKGPVARLLRVKDMSAATALEVTAGGKLYNVVVDNEETGKLLLEKGRLKRRYTIIPLNKIAAKTLSNDTVKRAQALVGKDKVRPALALVGYEDELRPAMAYIFGSTFICDCLQDAKKVTFDKGVMARSVSLTGDVFDPSGTLSGGARSNATSILAKLSELCGYYDQMGDKTRELEGVAQQLEEVHKLASKYKELKEQWDGKSHDAGLVETRMEQSTHHQQFKQLQSLLESIENQKDILQKAEETEKKAKAQLNEIQMKMKDSETHHARELKKAEETMSKCRGEAERLGREAGARQQEMDALKLEVEELNGSLQSQQQQVDASNETIAAKTAQLEEHTQEQGVAKKALSDARDDLEEQKATLRKMNKVEALLAKYDWIASDRKYFGQPNTAYDFVANDPKESSRRATKVQAQMEKLSKNVNMRAMNMLGKAEEKYADLMKKKKIVENDKSKISDLIAELDQKKNEALRGAHEQVNKDFGSIFSTLLPGASAKLAPQEGHSVLDGLEVRVAFGNVWKESLSELSGGQRSLIALSLILSLLLFKPAPLYILDEVDAALDLSHTQNIGQMLRTHFKQSQFIVVSLKDGMFNNANVLFKTKFVDGVSTVSRYVNPRASTSHAHPQAVEKGEEERRRATSKKTAKAVGGTRTRMLID